MTARYAIYYAPPPNSPLGRIGSSWLGRDAVTGAGRTQPNIPDIDGKRLEIFTATPRHYGFHATIKAPFELAPDKTPEQLHSAFADFCLRQSAITGLELKVAVIDDFLSLALTHNANSVTNFAAECVRYFDGFRAPLSAGDIERRRRASLSALEDALLLRWGYPYVMEAFHFHMTLTERLEQEERDRVQQALRHVFAPITSTAFSINDLALFYQERRDRPFRMLHRYPLGAAQSSNWDTNESTVDSSGPLFDSAKTSSPSIQ